MNEPNAPREPARWGFRIGSLLSRTLFRTYNRVEVTGRENLPPTGGVLLIANHTSYADPPIVGSLVGRPVNFMAKAQLFLFPLGPIIRSMQAFPVKRGAGDRAALRHAITLLRAGRVLLIFPEGTRSPNGKLIPFEQGAAFIALASGAQVVPVGVDGADRVLPLHGYVLHPAKLHVRIGPPVDLSDLRGERVTREAIQAATGRMEQALRAVLPPERQ